MAPCYGRLTHMGNEKTTCTRSLGEEIAKLQSLACFLPGLQHVPHCTERSRRAAESDPLLQNSKAWSSKKADSTLRSSQAVPHPSTNRALCCLTSEVERDPVHSTRYGRRRNLPCCLHFSSQNMSHDCHLGNLSCLQCLDLRRMQMRLAWPCARDVAHKSRSASHFLARPRTMADTTKAN